MSNIKYDVNKAFSKLLETPLNDEGRCYFVDSGVMYEINSYGGEKDALEIFVSRDNGELNCLGRIELNDKMLKAFNDKMKKEWYDKKAIA